jgi:predicted ferric reductase
MVNGLKESLDRIFNWRKKPASVFLLVVPLVTLAVVLLVMYAYLQYKVNDDIGYFVILGFFAVFSGVIGYFMRKSYKQMVKIRTVNSEISEVNKTTST